MLLLMAGFAVSPNLAAEEASPEGAAFLLPAKGERVSLAEIKTICEHFGLMKLWAKIEADPPGKPFESDGCTSWVDKVKGRSIYPACFLHELKYWAGYPGEKVERLAADAESMSPGFWKAPRWQKRCMRGAGRWLRAFEGEVFVGFWSPT